MVNLKNEAAGVVAIVGFVSLVLAVTGVAGLLDAVFGSGSVVLVTTETTAIQGNVTGAQEGGILGSAVLTAFGVAGLLVTHSAVQSGYFEPEASSSTTAESVDEDAGGPGEDESAMNTGEDDESEGTLPTSESGSQSEAGGDAGPA
jgi:hypothetical protein